MVRGLTVVIDADITRIQTALASVSGGLAGFAAKAQQVGTVLSASISAPLALIGKKAIDTFADMDSLRRGLATLEKDAGSLKGRLGELIQVARLPGLGYKEALQFDVSLRSAGFSADLSKRSMIAFGNALATVGKGKNELKGLNLQLQQLATKNGGFGADLRIIKEYAPQVQSALQKAFGTVDTEKIADMGVTGKQVVEKLVDELGKLPKATGGAKNAFENFSDATTNALDSVGAAIYKGLHIEGFLTSIGEAVTKLIDKFSNLPATTQTLIASFIGIMVVLPPLIAAIGFFTTTVLPALRAGMIAVRAASFLMMGPIGLIAGAVAIAATLIIMHWDKVKKFLADVGIWDGLKDIVRLALGVVTSIVGAFVNLLQDDWHNMGQHLLNTLKYFANGIISVFQFLLHATGGILAKIASLFGIFNNPLSKAIQDGTNKGAAYLESFKFKINAPKFDLFEGFQFGGQGNTEIPAADGKKKKKKGAKEKEDNGLFIDYLRERKAQTEKEIENYAALNRKVDKEGKLVPIEIPKELINNLRSYTDEIERAEAVLKRADIAPPAKLNPLNSNLGEVVTEARRQSKFADLKTPKLPGVESLTTQIKENAKLIADAYTSMRDIIKTAASQTAQDMATGLGEVIGGIATGQISVLSGLISLVTDFLSAYLSKLAQANMLAGTALIAAGAVSLNPFMMVQGKQKLTAGFGLQVASGAVKVVGNALQTKAFEKGGLITGPTMALMGESHIARSGGGEYVASVDLGSKLIAKNIMQMTPIGSGMERRTNRLNPYMGGAGMPLDIQLSGGARLSGSDLLIAIERAQRSRSNLGGRS